MPISVFTEYDYNELDDIIDLFAVRNTIQVTFEQEMEKIETLRPGYEAESIGDLPVLYDGDYFTLSDLATLATSRNLVKASVAGCPELVLPITHGKIETFNPWE